MAKKMISVKQLMFVLKLFQVSAGSIHCFGIRKETLRFMHPKVSGFGYDTKNSPSFLDFSKETKYPFSNKNQDLDCSKETSPN